MTFKQRMFYMYIIPKIKKERVEEAKKLIFEGFKLQDEGKFTKEYFYEVKDKYLDFIKEDKLESVKKALKSYEEKLN